MLKKNRLSLAAGIGILLCLLVLSGHGAIASAAVVTEMYGEKEGEKVSTAVDLNGDGSFNKISIYYSCQGDEYNSGYARNVYVEIDGKEALNVDVSGKCGYAFQAKLIQFGNGDTLLQLWAISDNDYIGYNCLFAYDKSNHKFIELEDFDEGKHRFDGSISYAYEDSIRVECSCQPTEIGRITWSSYYTWKDGKLKKQSGEDWLDTIKRLTVNQKLTFYKKPGSTKKAFTLKKGAKVDLTYVKVTKDKLYAGFRYKNKTGWLQVENEDYMPSYDDQGNVIGEWFKNVTKNLAG